MKIPPPSHEEVKVAIMRFKHNKAVGSDGLPTELFTIGCSGLKQGASTSLFIHPLPEKGRPSDMRQLQEYKSSPYRI